MNSLEAIAWSTCMNDKFILLKNSVRSLYKIEPNVSDDSLQTSKNSGVIKVSDKALAQLMYTCNENEDIRCFDLCPRNLSEQILAAGDAKGKIRIYQFSRATEVDSIVGNIYNVVDQPRHCNCLSWNRIHTQLIATGFDKYQKQSTVFITDVNRPNAKQLVVDCDDIRREFKGSNEAALDVSWLIDGGYNLVVGYQKQFKIFDIREPRDPIFKRITNCDAKITSAVGLSVDPLNHNRIATYNSLESQKGTISVWDLRKITQSLITLNENRNILRISWCPSRKGYLAALSAHSSVINLYDVTNSESDEIELAHMDRVINISPDQAGNVVSFSWHPTDKSRLLALTDQNDIKDISISERMSVSWSPEFSLSWTNDGRIVNCDTTFIDYQIDSDISTTMKTRAKGGYGCKSDVSSYLELTEGDSTLVSLWSYIHRMNNISPETDIKSTIMKGAHSILINNDNDCCRSTNISITWVLANENSSSRNKSQNSKRILYTSKERDRIIEMCGWSPLSERDSREFENKLTDLCGSNAERAAMIAVMNMNLSIATSILSKSDQENLRLLTIAISGFSDESNSMWKEVCSRLSPVMNNAHIRAIFHFLNSQHSPSYDQILHSEDLDLSDRVAFACLHLADRSLQNYLDTVMNHSVSEGNLHGLLVSGLSKEGLNLLETFLERTSDIQTTCLLSQMSIINDKRKDIWLQEYRELLDSWRMWHERADLDIFLKSAKTNPQLFITCNFCGKSISAARSANTAGCVVFAKPNTNMNRLNACPVPTCRKPLPRCAICLAHMGTPSRLVQTTGKTKQSNFSDWFTWCQRCRHGGHSSHLTEWFEENSDCPVTGCSCNCSYLDPVRYVCESETDN